MFTGRKLVVALLTMSSLIIPSDFIHMVYASVCHDNAWDPGEYCGHDAVFITGVEDMNHDCLVDALDFQLFEHDYNFTGIGAATGPNVSGDCKSQGAPGPAPCGGNHLCPDGRVTNADLGFFFTQFGLTASPCTAVPIPRTLRG